MRIFRSIITGLFFAVFIIVVISLSISFIYEDEVSELFLEEVNKRLKSDLQTEGVNLSLLKKFPNATIVLDDVKLTDLDTNRDTTLFIGAKSLFLQFDIVDLFNKNYSIDRVHAKDCEVRYFLSEKQDITQKEVKENRFKLDVNELKISRVHYVIENKTTGLKMQGFSEETVLSGNLSSQEFFMDVETQTNIKHLKANNFRYIYNKTISIDSDIKVTPDFYNIEKGRFSLEGIPFTIHGKLNRSENHLDLTCTGKNLSVSRLRLNIPWGIKKHMENVTITSGRINLFAKVNGLVKNEQPNIEADLKIQGGEFLVKNKIRLTNFDASMYYTNGIFNQPNSSSITFNNIEANYKNSNIEGNFTINNFKKPELEAKLDLNFELNDISQYADSLGFNDIGGSVTSTLNITTPVAKLDDFETLIKEKKLTGDFTLDRVNFNLDNIHMEKMNGFAYIDHYLYCDNLSFQVNETSDITFTGRLRNYYSNSSEELPSIRGKLNSKTLRLSEILGQEKKKQNGNFKLPQSISANLNVFIKNLYYKGHGLNEIKGRVILKPNLMKMKNVSFKTLTGNCKVDGYLSDSSEKDYYLNSRLSLNNVDIHESFKSFNNFGQDYIKAENIKGKLYGEFYFKSHMDSSLTLDPATLYNMSNFTIHQGELIQFKPLLELSNFISVSELERVKFSKFSNRITIEDETIQIPKMDINSSAMDLTISGFHKFNGEFKYNMNLLLSEILSRKAKPKVRKFGNIEEDGVGETRLYLLMRGDTANSTIKYDKQGVKAKIRKEIKEEKNVLKRMFNEEFGFFSKDSLTQTEKSGESRPDEFKIEWEGEKADSLKKNIQKQPESKDNKKNNSKFIIEWDKDTLSGLFTKN